MPKEDVTSDRKACERCIENRHLEFDFTMAFQPIVDCKNRQIFGYEALARGLNGEPAYSIISQLNNDNRYLFDQLCRVKAIALASKLKLKSKLSINFLPKAVYKPERCIRTTLQAAEEYGFATEQIMFEFTESEKIEDIGFLKRILEFYESSGFITAIDDFGSGHAGLNLLADFQTNIVKFDMGLIRGIHHNKPRQAIVKNCLNLFHDLGVTPLAEGIETREEMAWLLNAGVGLMQGYYFAEPGFEKLPEVNLAGISTELTSK